MGMKFNSKSLLKAIIVSLEEDDPASSSEGHSSGAI